MRLMTLDSLGWRMPDGRPCRSVPCPCLRGWKSVLGWRLTSTSVCRWPQSRSLGHWEVRSGHQLNSYSLGFSQSRICVKKFGFFKHAHSRFAFVILDNVLGPAHLAWHTWRCPCVSGVPETMQEVRLRALEGRCVSSKCPSRVWDPDKGVAATVVSHIALAPTKDSKIAKWLIKDQTLNKGD